MNAKELYVLGYFDEDGNFDEFVRKGRNFSISGYDNLSSAKRGLAQSNIHSSYEGEYRIIKANVLEVIE